MKKSVCMMGLALLVVSLGACSGPGGSGGEAIAGGVTAVTGSVAYRERIALAEGSVVNVALNDISLADVPAVTLGDLTIVTDGEQVPIAFELSVDKSAIRPGMTYAVRAEIRDAADRLQWTTDTVHRVELDRLPDAVDVGTLPLVRVMRTAAGSADTDTLAGSRWTVVSIAGQAVAEDSRAALVFGDDGSFSGNASCNSFSGRYSLSGSELNTGKLAVTMMACPETSAGLERRFLSVLDGGSRISFNAEALLVVTGTSGDTIIARREPENPSLEATRWKVTRVGGEAVPENSPAELVFGEDGTLSGNAGCNRFTGSYSLSGTELQSGQMAITAMACPELPANLERDLLGILGETATVAIDAEGRLIISSADGKSIVASAVQEDSPEN